MRFGQCNIQPNLILSALLALTMSVGIFSHCSAIAQTLDAIDWNDSNQQMTTVSDIMSAPSANHSSQESNPEPETTEENLHPAVLTEADKIPAIRGKHQITPASQIGSTSDLKTETIVSYSAVPAVVVFPVLKHHGEKTFGDLPQLFASELSLLLEDKMPESIVMNPVYTVDTITMQGLGHIYDKVMDYYIRAGRPEPKALDYLLRQVESQDQPITRVMFVEADIDLTDPSRPKGLWGIRDRFRGWLDDTNPSHLKYHIRSRVHVFNTEDPDMPRMWTFNWKRPVKLRDFENVTASVYEDSDNIRVLGQESRVLGRSMLLTIPKHVYMEKEVTTGVKGKLAKGNSTP